MRAFENQLTDIAVRQGISVDKVVQLTKENEHILAQQKVSSCGIVHDYIDMI